MGRGSTVKIPGANQIAPTTVATGDISKATEGLLVVRVTGFSAQFLSQYEGLPRFRGCKEAVR